MEKKDYNPIFYKDKEELKKPLSELMEQLRLDVSRIRGKLFDIKMTYGWEGRIDFIEGGLTCMLVAMHSTMEEWQKFEAKNKTQTP